MDHGDTINVGEVQLSVIHLRGHTPGSIAILYDDPTGHPHLFTGVRYAIVLPELANCGSNDPECFGWYAGPAGDPYPAGAGFTSRDAGVTWTPLSIHGSTDFAFKTYVTPPRFTKEQCKKGGWRRFADPAFRNQGQCIKYVNHQGAKAGKRRDDEKGEGKRGKGSGGKKR